MTFSALGFPSHTLVWKTSGLLSGWGVGMAPTGEQVWVSLTSVGFLFERGNMCGKGDSGLSPLSALGQNKATMVNIAHVQWILSSTRWQPASDIHILIASGQEWYLLPEEVKAEIVLFISTTCVVGLPWLAQWEKSLYTAQSCGKNGKK